MLVRVAPDVHTDTHRYLQTGHAASKFGFPLGNGEAKAAMLRIIGDGKLRLLGLHAHSGTMLREARPYQESLERLLTLANEVYPETQLVASKRSAPVAAGRLIPLRMTLHKEFSCWPRLHSEAWSAA